MNTKAAKTKNKTYTQADMLKEELNNLRIAYEKEHENSELLKKIVAVYEAKIEENEKNLNIQNELRSKENLAVINEIKNEVKRLSENLHKLIQKNEETYNSKLKNATQNLEHSLKKVQAENESLKKSITFQLGSILISSSKSLKGLLKLPIELWALRKISKYRKIKKYQAAQQPKINVSNKIESDFKQNNKIKFISILDEISKASWEKEFVLFDLNRNTFQQQIETSTSKALFLESCWKGNDSKWEFAFTSPELQHVNAQALCQAIDIAKQRKLPVIFWNKEDPMHYDKFLKIASQCDIIFTTDSNKVADYHRDVPNAKVKAIEFAASPILCNPSERFRIISGTICFAGSYYSVGHDDRKKQMDAILPVIIKNKGVIYDRMSKLNNKRYSYPKKYIPYIRESVSFKEIVNIYKSFKLFLNVNTITDSPTMMSRRVYELLACGTPVISTPSLAIEKQFPDIVQIADTAKQANKIVDSLLGNEWDWLRLSHKGYREVMLKHTYENRAMQIAKILDIDYKTTDELATIVMATNRPQYIDRIVQNITCQNYSNIELIIIVQGYSADQITILDNSLKHNNSGNIKSIQIVQNDSQDTLGMRLNQGINLSTGAYIAKFDDDDFYFDYYLTDMMIPFKFTDCGIVGKKEIFVYLEGKNQTIIRYKDERHKVTDFVVGPTFIFKRSTIEKIKFGDLNKGEDSDILSQAKKNGIKIYAADPFNFIQFRSKNISAHTWQVDDEFFKKNSQVLGNGKMENIVRI